LVKSTSYEAPHYVVFSNLLSLQLSSVTKAIKSVVGDGYLQDGGWENRLLWELRRQIYEEMKPRRRRYRATKFVIMQVSKRR
jgi:hypothetical protein